MTLDFTGERDECANILTIAAGKSEMTVSSDFKPSNP